MPFYKVTNTYKYTATAYVEADSMEAAIDMSQEHETVNSDDSWSDYDAVQIDQEEYEDGL